MSFKGLNFNFIIAAVTIAVGLLVCTAVTTTLNAASYSQIASVTTALTQQMSEIQAGGGNATDPLTKFTPQKVEINTGQSITWVNPTTVG